MFPVPPQLLSLSTRSARLPRTPGGMGVLWGCPEPWGASQLSLSLPCPQVGDVEPELGAADSWIGVVPVGTEEPAEGPRGAKEESFTTAVVTKVTLCLTLCPLPGPVPCLAWGLP